MSQRQQPGQWKRGGQPGGGGGDSGGRRQQGQGAQRSAGGGGGQQYQGGGGGGYGGGGPPQRRAEQSSSRQFYQGGGGGGGYNRGGGDYNRGGGGGGRYSRGGGGDGYRAPPQSQSVVPLKTVKATDVDRRKFVGTLGKKIDLIANYFNLAYQAGRNVTNYHVEVTRVRQNGANREIKNKTVIRDFFWKIVKDNETFFGGPYNLVFDDRHQLYTWKPLNIEGDKHQVQSTLRNGDGAELGVVAMEIKKTRTQPVDFNVLNLLLSQFARCPISTLYSKVYCEIDRIFLRPTVGYEPLDLNYALIMLKGVQANVKKGPGGSALANYDVAHSAFYKVNVDVLQFYAFVKTGRELNPGDYSTLKGDYSLNYKQRREMRTILNGLMMKTKIGLITNYRFTDVSDKTARTTRFVHETRDKDGKVVKSEETTVEQYFKKKYGKTLEFPNMPLIQCGPRDKNLLFPIETLMLHDDFQRLRAKLPDVLIAKTNRFTTKYPNYRFDDINKMMEDLKVSTDDPFLGNAKVNIDQRFLQIEGRVLPAPVCAFNKPFNELMKAKAVTAPQKKIVFSVVVVNNCIRLEDKTKNAFDWLVLDCEKRGMIFAQKGPIEWRDYRFNKATLGDFLIECQKKAADKHPDAILMLIIVVGNQDNLIYDSVKTECEINIGILSQVLLSKTYYKIGDKMALQNSVTRNIFLKLNAKLGGVNNQIVTPGSQENWKKFADPSKPTLFIGIDVTHQAPGDTEFPSIAALVSNLNVHSTIYSATVRVQMVRTEEIIAMEEMCTERIYEFKKHNKNYPAHIVVFRDGVSESQFESVVEVELAALKRACAKIHEKYAPNFTVIVVQKRHSTRFYAPDANFPGVNNGNTPPGTVVDRFITNETKQIKEFFLCPHKGMLGTSRPIRCYILYDDWNLSADDLEICTYNLCHLFARAPMPVSLPAPVFYAHLCCYRARRHFSAQRDERDRASDKQRMVTVCESIRNNMYFC